MKLIDWIKFKFGRNNSGGDLQSKFFKCVDKFSRNGRVEIYNGSIRALNDSLFNRHKRVYIIVIDVEDLNAEKEFKKWFEEYKA